MSPRIATLSARENAVEVHGDGLRSDRRARLFCETILGGTTLDDGWLCPRRRLTTAELVVRIAKELRAAGWEVQADGDAAADIGRERQRRDSFERTRERARAVQERVEGSEIPGVLDALRAFGWDESARELRSHQQLGVAHALAAGNAANFSVPGSGKTISALAVAAAHMASGTIDSLVVVGPLSSFRPWEVEAEAALPGRLKVVRVRGTKAQRAGIYDSADRGNVLLLSYATAATDQGSLAALCRRMKVMLVVDESHRIKRFQGGWWATAMLEIAKHAAVRMILSGTPMPQSGKDLYTQLRVLWPGGELTGTAGSFADRVASDLQAVLAQIKPFVSRTPKAALGIPPFEVIYREVEMLPLQGEIYRLVASGLARGIQRDASQAAQLEALRRGRSMRLLQAAANPDLLNRPDLFYELPADISPNAPLIDRLRAYRRLEKPAKTVAALELLEAMVGRGEKAVVWSSFIFNLDDFAASVRTKLGIPVFQVDGRVKVGDEDSFDTKGLATPPEDDTRESRIERFLSIEGPAVLVANPASCSESISLHRSCRNAIYLDRTYDCAQFLQSIDRIHRLGLPPDAEVRVHILQSLLDGAPTIDGLVDASLLRKQAVMREVLEGAELVPMGAADNPLADAEGSQDDLVELLQYLLALD